MPRKQNVTRNETTYRQRQGADPDKAAEILPKLTAKMEKAKKLRIDAKDFQSRVRSELKELNDEIEELASEARFGKAKDIPAIQVNNYDTKTVTFTDAKTGKVLERRDMTAEEAKQPKLDEQVEGDDAEDGEGAPSLN